MSVWIRRSLYVLLGLVLVLAAVATWLVVSFDPNQFKGTAVEWMKTHRQRTLVMDGPIELSVFPRLAVKLSKVKLSEAGRPDTFASLDEAGLAVDVLPLLRGELVVGRVSAKGVRITYRRDAHGKSSVDDMLKPRTASPSDDKSGAVRFDIDGVDLTDVRVRIQDDVAKVDGELWLKSFSAGRLADNRVTPLELLAQFDFKQPAVRGELSGDTRLKLDTATSSAALSDMNLRFKGDVPGAAALDATVEGDVAWNGSAKSVEAQTLQLRFGADAAGMKLAGSQITLDRFGYDPARQTLTLRKLAARIKGIQGTQPLALELDWPELSVAGSSLSGSPFSGKLSRGGELPLDVAFKSGAPSGGFDAVRLPGFEARLTGHSPQRKLAGTLRSDLTLKPGAPSLTLDKLDLQARIEEPNLPPFALAVRGAALASSKRSTWALQGQLNQNAFHTDGVATLGGSVPHVVAKARFDALDLNRLAGPDKPAGAKPGAPHSDTPVDMGPLRRINGELSLHAGSFAWRQYRIGDAAIDAVLDGGTLRVTRLQGKAWGGTVNATALADARGRVAIQGAANGVNVNALVKDVAAKDLIEGTGRLTLNLDTGGRSVNEFKSHLKGSAALQVRDGALKGINLAKILRQAKAALSMKQESAQRASQTEKTDFSELSATFQIADGVARNRDLDMKSPFLRLGGEGTIDVGRGRIDYAARATVTPTSKGQDGAELAALKGLTVPVRLVGPFDAMDWKIDWSSAAAAAMTQRLEQKLGERLGITPSAGAASAPPLEEALKNRLKGLFK